MLPKVQLPGVLGQLLQIMSDYAVCPALSFFNAAGDDSIYMLPEVQLPRVLGQLPALEQQRQALARQLLLDLVQDPGAAVIIMIA
jgi:hypothetical protein